MLSSGHGELLHSLVHGNYGYLHTLKSTRLVNAPAGSINWTKGHTYAKGGDRRWCGGVLRCMQGRWGLEVGVGVVGVGSTQTCMKLSKNKPKVLRCKEKKRLI